MRFVANLSKNKKTSISETGDLDEVFLSSQVANNGPVTQRIRVSRFERESRGFKSLLDLEIKHCLGMPSLS